MLPRHQYDSLIVKREDGLVITIAINPHGLVVMGEDTTRHQTETIRFSDHPELLGIYDDGWVLPEVAALCDSIQIKSVRLPR